MSSPTDDAAADACPVNFSSSQQCCAADGKCNQESCHCGRSCSCNSNHEQSSQSLKPIDCKNSNSEACSDGSCKLAKPTDPTHVRGGKCQAPAFNEGSKNPHCKDKNECEGKKMYEGQSCTNKNECQLSKQKGECCRSKAELKPCAHSEGTIHKQEEHQKVCSPLPQGDKLKAILFDIDGTIADSDRIHFLAFQEILVEVSDDRTGAEMWMQEGYNGGVPISHEFFLRQMSGKLNYAIAEELMPEMDEKKRMQMMDEKEARYRILAAKDLQPIPGFHQFSEYVKKRGLRRAAVTNSPRLNAEQVISALKIPDFFEIVVVGSECDNPKPYPDPYLKAIKFLGVDPNQCFVFEDSPSGVKAGRAAGSPVVGLLTGHPGPVLRDNGASVLIQDYHDSALWTALGEEPCAGSSCSQSHDSTPSTRVPPPIPVPA